MADRSYPFSVAVVGSVRLGATEAEAKAKVAALVDAGLTADSSRAGWIQRQQALSRLRYGIRRKKTFPWPNCANLAVPLIDGQIRKFKPQLIRLLVEADPVVEFVGEDPDAVNGERLAEAEYNWLFKTEMSAIEPMCYIVDSIAHRGYGVAQVGWDYLTEYECRVLQTSSLLPPGLPPDKRPNDPQVWLGLLAQNFSLDLNDARVRRAAEHAALAAASGAEWIKFSYKHVIRDRPALWDRDPMQMIVPPRTVDYSSSPWIIVQHLLSARELQQKEADGLFDRGVTKDIVGDLKRLPRNASRGSEISGSMSLSEDKNLQDERERIWGTEDEDNILVWEIYHWHDIDGDGLPDRVVTFVHPRTRKVLSSRPYSFPFRRWPFVKFDFEKISRRFHSPRGISGMLEHVQREVNAQHNGRLDAMTLRNAPVYQAPVLAGFKSRNFRYSPGTLLQVPLGAQITPVMQDRGSFPESVNEENLLRQVSESYIGTFDNALSSSSGDNRTATEVQAAVQLAASTASLDTILFQLAMRELHTMIWELWIAMRPPEITIRVTGLDREATGPVARTIARSEIDKRFKLIPTGTIANTNHALELSNAREALTFFANDQTGFIDPLELRRWYFGLLDYRRARRIVLGPAQAQEMNTLRAAAAALQQDPTLAASQGAPVQPQVASPEQTEVVNEQPY